MSGASPGLDPGTGSGGGRGSNPAPGRPASRSSRSRCRPSVSRSTPPITAATAPSPVPPAIRHMIRTWYFTASAGATPAWICPVIIPGSATCRVAALALTMGFVVGTYSCVYIAAALFLYLATRTSHTRAGAAAPARSRS